MKNDKDSSLDDFGEVRLNNAVYERNYTSLKLIVLAPLRPVMRYIAVFDLQFWLRDELYQESIQFYIQLRR